MDFSILNSESFKDILEAEIVKNYHAHIDIVFVDDIADWFAERSDDCIENPAALAARDTVTGDYKIIFRKEIDSERVENIIIRMHMGGFKDASEIISSPDKNSC